MDPHADIITPDLGLVRATCAFTDRRSGRMPKDASVRISGAISSPPSTSGISLVRYKYSKVYTAKYMSHILGLLVLDACTQYANLASILAVAVIHPCMPQDPCTPCTASHPAILLGLMIDLP